MTSCYIFLAIGIVWTDMDNDIVQELRDLALITEEVQGKAIFSMLSGEIFSSAADEIEQLRSEINGMANAQNGWGKVQRLKEAGDDLVAVMRSGSDCGWDNAIDAWESATRG